MILILSDTNDSHADRVEAILHERGVAFRRMNPADFPSCQLLSLHVDSSVNGACRPSCRWGEVSLEHDVSTIWYRRPGRPSATRPGRPVPVRDYIEAESRALFEDMWSTLSCRWLPGNPHDLERAKCKMLQLREASSVGLEIPATLVTNDPEQAREFYCEHGGHIISKLASGAFHKSSLANTIRRYTEPVTRRDLGYLDAVKHCPILLQADVPKQFELRCTVVDGQAFTAAIHSQQSRRTRHDWRRYDRSRTPYARFQLPDQISDQLLELVGRLRMRFGAIDLIYTRDGRYVFVEINPNGQFLFIEQATSLPISAAIADALSTAEPCISSGVHHDNSFLPVIGPA